MNKIKIGEKVEDKVLYNIYIANVTSEMINKIEVALDKYAKSTYAIKREINDKFKLLHGFKLTNTIAYGDNDIKNSSALSKFIIGKHMIQQLGNGVVEDTMAYPCFRGDNYIYKNEYGLILHQDKTASWKCLSEKINNYKNILIYKDNG